MKTCFFAVSICITLLLAGCTQNPEHSILTGYIGQQGFSVSAEDIIVVKDKVNMLPVYEIRALINGEDSLFVTFTGVTVGDFKYFLPGEGLNMATFFDASEEKYFGTHISREGFGKLTLVQDAGIISGELDLVMYDTASNPLAITEVSFHHLPVHNGRVSRVGQVLEFSLNDRPNWSRKIDAAQNGGLIHLDAKTSKQNRLEVIMPADPGNQVYDLSTNSVHVAIIDSMGTYPATAGQFIITRHHKKANYVEVRFNARRATVAQELGYELTNGLLRFTYYE